MVHNDGPSSADWTNALSSSGSRWSDSIDSSRITNLRYISHGSFAVVYRGDLQSIRNEGLGLSGSPGSSTQPVAIKVLRPAHAGRPASRRSFLQELAVHRLLKHRSGAKSL